MEHPVIGSDIDDHLPVLLGFVKIIITVLAEEEGRLTNHDRGRVIDIPQFPIGCPFALIVAGAVDPVIIIRIEGKVDDGLCIQTIHFRILIDVLS